MKITCSACQAQYTIADEKVPPQGARVRCRKCQAVFSISPTTAVEKGAQSRPAAADPVAQAPAAPAPAAAAPAAAAQEPSEPPPIRPAPLPTIPPAGTPVTPEPRQAAAAAEPEAESHIPAGLSPEERAKHERARRLARVLASDIAIYNQEKRERGLRDGNLVAVLGYEIKKSWEVYKERVSPELANATPYFRDALNQMLAGGKKVF